jgi:hypothetical protein
MRNEAGERWDVTQAKSGATGEAEPGILGSPDLTEPNVAGSRMQPAEEAQPAVFQEAGIT